MLKSELRKTYLSKQKSLSLQNRSEKSEQIAAQFFDNFTLEDVKNLHIFLPIKRNNEVGTRFIYEKIWRDFPHIRTFAPRVRELELEHLELTKNTKLAESNWGIPEPIGDKLFVENEIDVVIVPLLALDARGFRVGYGKGFYDKFLAKCRVDCLKIGLSYFEPIAQIVDINEFDVKLDYCLTPHKTFRFLTK